ncbi:MAG: hypothetical protein SOZ83_05265 [Sphaerochaetaceae bacterium]|nr:hypothetical protein [Sphaerochaetaceae bacterium]
MDDWGFVACDDGCTQPLSYIKRGKKYYLDNFSSLEHLESIEVKSDKKVSLYFNESKRFKIAEFKRELKFPW